MNIFNPELAELTESIVELSEALMGRGISIATVESCTGGSVAALFTDLAGSSRWFDRGFVTYSNASKVEMVGVSGITLSQHGAVSEAVAREMAEGGVRCSDASCALSITGIAGPEGGSDEKPVGTVCFGWTGFDNSTHADTRHFQGDREAVRMQSVIYAIRSAIDRFE